MMNEVVARAALALIAVAGSLGAWTSFRAARCNYQRARASFLLSPLEHASLADLANHAPRRLPSRWPEPASIAMPELRTAYAQLAHDHADNRLLAGELSLIFAGAVAGATVTSLLTSYVAIAWLVVALLVGTLGIALRTFSSRRWMDVADQYEPPARKA
jgi:hypothetical protein